MKSKKFMEIGMPGHIASLAVRAYGQARQSGADHEAAWATAISLPQWKHWEDNKFQVREVPAPKKIWGEAHIEKGAIEQIDNACSLPVSERAALMPDAHQGYGLPIGGVLAVKNAVIPYAVGVDIACRMMMTVTDIPIEDLDTRRDRICHAISRETAFGMGANFAKKPRWHGVLDKDWNITKKTAELKDKAHEQLGSSGGGNHFVEFGEVSLGEAGALALGVEPGNYVGILSHSGSRGAGASVADFYTQLAMSRHTDMPDHLKHLAWLSLDSEAGQEYWLAMNLMGDYAQANHHCIHRELRKNLGFGILAQIENHHNFAWKEMHDGQELIVHRKGATPASRGELGIIPGTMADVAHIVVGLGNDASLRSASHGAGRLMSRKKAEAAFDRAAYNKKLKEKKVHVISAGKDEAPHSYKPISAVMACQADLVKSIGTFQPRIVKMAPDQPKRRRKKKR